MPTLADLQALRKKQEGVPTSGIQLPGPSTAPNANGQPTLADLQALRDKGAGQPVMTKSDVSPVQNQEERPIGIGTKIMAGIAAPGFASAQLLAHPVDSAKIAGQGLKSAPQDIVEGIRNSAQGAVQGAKTAMSSDEPVLRRIGAGLSAGLSAASIPFQPITTGVENTYGRLASQGSKMADPRGRQLVSPQIASILPLTVGGGVGGKKPPVYSDLAQSAKNMGIDASKVKEPEHIAKAINEGLDRNSDEFLSEIAPRVPKGPTLPGTDIPNAAKLNTVGGAIARTFGQRTADNRALWSQVKDQAATIPVDTTSVRQTLSGILDKVSKAKAEGAGDAEDALRDALEGLGEQRPQDITEHTILKGGTVKTTTGLPELPEDVNRTRLTISSSDPTLTSTKGRKSVTLPGETEQQVVRQGDNQTVTTSPQTITRRVIKGDPPGPPKATTAADLVEARIRLNKEYGSHPATEDAVRAIDAELDKIPNAGFQNGRRQANASTQRLKEEYTNDQSGKELGMDLKTLQVAQQLGRTDATGKVLSPRADVLNKLNTIVDKVKTPQHIIYLSNQKMHPVVFAGMMRDVAYRALQRAGADPKKLAEINPLLQSIAQVSGRKIGDMSKLLDNRMQFAQHLEDYNIPDRVKLIQTDNKGMLRKGLYHTSRAIANLVSGNLGWAAVHAGEGLAKAAGSRSAPEQALKMFREQSLPKVPRNIKGPAIGAALGVRDANSGN